MAHKQGKQYQASAKQVQARDYPLEEAVPLLQKIKYAKFDETVEVHLRLGVDPKHADQMVRGTVVMPNGLGKSKKVLVIASGDKQKEAEDAGADFVGGENMVNNIQPVPWISGASASADVGRQRNFLKPPSQSAERGYTLEDNKPGPWRNEP